MLYTLSVVPPSLLKLEECQCAALCAGTLLVQWLAWGHALNNQVMICVYVQGLGRAAIDALVIHATRTPKVADESPPPAYSSVGTIEYGPLQLQSMMLNAALNSLETPEDWQYLGRHALPICLPAFTAAANRLMFQSRSADDERLVEKNAHMRPFFTMLREVLQLALCSFACKPGPAQMLAVLLSFLYLQICLNLA